MKNQLFLLLLISYAWRETLSDKPRSCSKFELNTLWTSSLRDSPLMATPLLIDIDGDSLRDIVAPSQSGEVYAIHGENGHIVDNWPFFLEDRSFYASPLAYDIDGNGVLDIVLTTTDAELVFLRPDGTLFHGETVKIPPVRVKREWYQLDKQYIDNLVAEMSKQIGHRFKDRFKAAEEKAGTQRDPLSIDNPTDSFSAIVNLMGTKVDPLFSRHQHNERQSGIDPADHTHVFVDAHILATPVLADLDEDGITSELIIPVSYYFDRYQYGDHTQLVKTRLPAEELQLYCAEGIVVVDLKTRSILKQKILGLTKVNANQPAYLLNSPTVVKLAADSPISIIVGSATGKLHVLEGAELSDRPGFPLTTDSISAQVAVEDLIGNDDVLEMVVGDNSGNVVCVGQDGKRLWEYEAKVPIESSVRFANLNSDKTMDVVLVTKYGDLYVLDGTNGQPLEGFPLVLNTLVHSSVFLTHITPKASNNDYRLSAIVPAITGMYVVDLYSHCVDHIDPDNDIIPHTLQSDHIDPFNPGIEILASSLSGELMLFSTSTIHPTDYEISLETWPADTLNGNGFTHKQSSFALVCGRGLTPRDATGHFFPMSFEIHDNRTSVSRPHAYHVSVTVGNLYPLFHEVVIVDQGLTKFIKEIPTPPIPTRTMVTLQVCNVHRQCDYATFMIRFNQTFEETFAWCLAFPFFVLVASYLWLLRNESTISLPTVIKSH